jgi:hypothetical protein
MLSCRVIDPALLIYCTSLLVQYGAAEAGCQGQGPMAENNVNGSAHQDDLNHDE